ncbi:MAG: hypothetical protein ACLP7O_13555 [Terracidiphilus sp.]
MEISPIPGIRALPVMKSPPAGPELTPLFDIENTPRIGDEIYSPSNGKPARGAEDDGSEDVLDDLEDGGEHEPETGSVTSSAEKNPNRQISFFA